MVDPFRFGQKQWDHPGVPPEMVRIVCMSDIHHHYHRIFEVPDGDFLLIAGDLTNRGKKHELAAFNDWLDRQPHRYKVIIPGNHDISFESNEDFAREMVPAADAILIHEFLEAGGIRIYGEPCQPEFFDWAFNVPRNKMKERVWDKIPTDKPIDVLLTHGPPWGVCDYTSRGAHAGCNAQREWILEHQPRVVVCGHIHSGYGQAMLGNTLVVNAATCNERYVHTNPPVVVDLSV